MKNKTDSPKLEAGTASGRRYVLRKQVKPDPNQPRKEFDKEKLQSLADSFGGKAEGILECLKVREDGANFILIDGERRWRAADLAGIERLPIEVIAPADVLKTQLIFGTQRVNLNALEEALTAKRLLDQRQKENAKFTVEDLGKELGKPRASIYELLALVKVSQPVREALLAGKLDASKARLFATVSPDLHTKLLKEAEEDDYGDGPMSVRDLKEHIERDYSRQLGKATFDTKRVFDAMAWTPGLPVKGQKGQLVKVDTCTGCPLRSGNIEGWEGSPNVCTSVTCFDAKTKRHGEQVVTEAKASGARVVQNNSGCDYATHEIYTGSTFKSLGALAKAAKVTPAIYVNADGEPAEVFTAEDRKAICKHHGIKRESSGSGPSKAERQRQQLKAKVDDAAIAQVVAAVEAKPLTLLAWQTVAGALISTAWSDSVHEVIKRRKLDFGKDRYTHSGKFAKTAETMTEAQCRGLLFEFIVCRGLRGFHGVDKFTRTALAMFKVDKAKIAKQIAAEVKKPKPQPKAAPPAKKTTTKKGKKKK